ncbi:hypothetical protein [Hoeflea sp. BAL378]|nr:hypothetical protein [Hoeflea sp. BAL378]
MGQIPNPARDAVAIVDKPDARAMTHGLRPAASIALIGVDTGGKVAV